MSSKLLLREYPQRALAILTDSFALIFRHSRSTSAGASSSRETSTRPWASKCIVEFTTHNALELRDYRMLRSGICGIVGLININTDIFLCIISRAACVATGTYTLQELAFSVPKIVSNFPIKSRSDRPLAAFNSRFSHNALYHRLYTKYMVVLHSEAR